VINIDIDIDPGDLDGMDEQVQRHVRQQISVALTKGLEEFVATYSDLDKVLETIYDYGLTLRRRDDAEAVPVISLLPSLPEQALDWSDAIERGLDVGSWTHCMWPNGDLWAVCPVGEVLAYFEVTGQ
jgi:hypothetical protein